MKNETISHQFDTEATIENAHNVLSDFKFTVTFSSQKNFEDCEIRHQAKNVHSNVCA